METLSFEFPAGQPPKGRALVGCVGSGDLEVLLEPGTAGTSDAPPQVPDGFNKSPQGCPAHGRIAAPAQSAKKIKPPSLTLPFSAIIAT